MTVERLTNYCVVTAPVFDEIEGFSKRVVFVTRTAKARVIDEASWQHLVAGDFDQLPAEIIAELRAIELLIPKSEDEFQTVMNQNDAAIVAEDSYYTVVQPTANCQLGCDYCGQEHTNQLLGPFEQQVLVGRIRTAMRGNKRYSRLSVCWFGGEPLLGISVIRNLTPQLQHIAAEADCPYEAKVVTNGLMLTEEIAVELVQRLGVRTIEITLDGVAKDHDGRRHNKGGAPTFDKILSNLVTVARRADLDFGLNVRCNVDRRNYQSVIPLINLLAEKGLQRRIDFYAASVYSWGNEAHELSLTPDEFASWEIRWFIEQIRLGFAPSLIPRRKPIVCFSVLPNSRLVDAYGSLFNCTEVSYVPAYGKPNRFAVGHLTGRESVERLNILGNFNGQVRRGDYPCSSCRMLPVCGGSCPKKWIEGYEPCPSAKRNIEQRLLLGYAASRQFDAGQPKAPGIHEQAAPASAMTF